MLSKIVAARFFFARLVLLNRTAAQEDETMCRLRFVCTVGVCSSLWNVVDPVKLYFKGSFSGIVTDHVQRVYLSQKYETVFLYPCAGVLRNIS